MTDRTTILYILGPGRSGSTLLQAMLSRSAEFFATGELMCLWEYRHQPNYLCTCGQRLRACGFWREVLPEAFAPAGEALDYQTLRRFTHRNTLRLVSNCAQGIPIDGNALEPYTSATTRLYRKIQEVSRARLLIDSSKASSYALFLSSIPTLDVRLVHLVRDPRAVAHSWTRRRLRLDFEGDDRYMGERSHARSTWHWLTRTLAAEALRLVNPHYIRVRYEDLVARPETELLRILNHAGTMDLSLVGTSRMIAPIQYHAVGGNPNRFIQQPVPLKLDDEWERSMRSAHFAGISAMTAPLLLRYGYPLAPPSHHRVSGDQSRARDHGADLQERRFPSAEN